MPTSVTWYVVSTADLSGARPAALVEAVRTKTRAPGEPDPVPGLISGVVNELRGVIGFRSPAQVSATAGSLPPSLVEFAVQKICRVMKGKLAMPLNEDERTDERTYQSRLNALRDGDWPVDLPSDPQTTTAQAGSTGYFGGNTAVPIEDPPLP